MIIPLIAGALYCATPTVDNRTETWTKHDQETLLLAQKVGCKNFDTKTPCLTHFVKFDEDQYDAKCGPEKRRKE